MSVTSGQVGVTGAAVVVVAAANANYGQALGGYRQANRSVVVSNGTGTTVWLGGTTGVSSGTGFPLAASTTVTISLHLDEAICAVAGATGSTVSFVATGS